MVALRYTSSGDLDPTFAGGSPLFLSAPNMFTEARSVKLNGRGSVLVSGMTPAPSHDLVPTIFRLDATGAADTTFGSGGELQLPTAEAGFGGNIALAHDGNIVTAFASDVSANAWVMKVLDHDPLGIEYPSGF
jgi:hypothetical protein